MTSPSNLAPMTPEQRASYGVARAKTIAFEAVHTLWRRRRKEGKSQAELAKVLGKDEGWLSKNLRGPGNWTMKTFGELVEALDGELDIVVHGVEDPLPDQSNYHAYAEYDPRPVLLEGGTTVELDRISREKMLSRGSSNTVSARWQHD